MEPREIRERIRADHAALRPLLAAVAELARRVEAGQEEAVEPLRERGVALHDRFAEHLALEDRILLPFVRRSTGDGPARAERIAREHTEQRLLLDYILGRLRDQRRPSLVLGRELLGFVDLLQDEMEEEERDVLDAPLPN
jgi:hemerythrin-like domain-containing protein